MQPKELWRRSGVALCVLTLCACTVVELDAQGKPMIPTDPAAAPSYNNMTPEAIVAQFWQEKLLPDAQQRAITWEQLKQQQDTLADGVSRSVFIKIPGQISRLERTEREARLDISLQRDAVSLQLGPIVRGNAIRDAASFIRFDDFKNQVQFAQLSRALNKKALQGLPAVDDSWQGSNVTVLAAVTFNKQDVVDAVPLALHKEAP